MPLNLKNLFYLYTNKKKEIYFLIFAIIIYLLTYYNYFSVNLFFWDDKDIVFHIERYGYEKYIFDPNFSPRFFKQSFHALFYFLFEYNYKLYKLSYISFNFLSAGFFYYFTKKLFSNNNLALLGFVLFSTFTSIDVFHTSIVLLPNAISLSLYLLSFILTINYVETNSKIRKLFYISIIFTISTFVNLLHFPYFYFSELARIILIIFLLIKTNKISLNFKKDFDLVILYILPFIAFLIVFIVWILFFETKFLGRTALPAEDYQAQNFLNNFLYDPVGYIITVINISLKSLANLILSPFSLMFHSLDLINDGSRFFYIKTYITRFLLIFLLVFFSLRVLDFYFGILDFNTSKKQNLIYLIFALVLTLFMLSFASIALKYVMFNYVGGFSRYALPGYIFLPLVYIFLLKILFSDKRIFLVIFSILLSLQISNGYLTSRVYDTFENDKKKQLSQIIWRFDNFSKPTDIILEDDKYAANTTLMLDKDHFLLNLHYDKPKNFINLRRINLSEPKILIENYYANLDLIKNNPDKFIIAFKTKYSECYEFIDQNTFKKHPRSFYIENIKISNKNVSNEPIHYKANRYYKSFNKMKIYNEADKTGKCYFYQISKKLLIQKKFDELSQLTKKFIKFDSFSKVHEHNNEYDYFILKPFYISLLKEGGIEEISILKKSINWFQPHINKKIEILCDSIDYLKLNKLDYNAELNNLCESKNARNN